MRRRAFLTSSAALLAAVSGCNAVQAPEDGSVTGSPTGDGADGERAHTVTVYLGDREATRDVNVRVESADDDVLFERSYELSDANEADEDATFPASTNPDRVLVTVDGERFERSWPHFHGEDASCHAGNWQGIEVWVEGQPGDPPSVRIEQNCQHVTMA